MFVKYILRLDDAHHRMNHEKWRKIENICAQFDIKPIAAVIPDNRDESINCDEYDADFWGRVLSWQESGWSIAMHGYQHVLRKSRRGLVPINDYSEFTDLCEEAQFELIRGGLDIFQEHNINARLWVAPAHGMDINTVKSLLRNSINIVSDGFSFRGYERYGINWIPQQLWKGREMYFGTWTICLHPSEMTSVQIDSIATFIQNNSENFTSIDKLIYKKHSMLDSLFGMFFLFLLKIKNTNA